MIRTKKIIAVVAIAMTSTLGVAGLATARDHHGNHRGHHHGDGIVRELVDILSDVL